MKSNFQCNIAIKRSRIDPLRYRSFDAIILGNVQLQIAFIIGLHHCAKSVVTVVTMSSVQSEGIWREK